MTESRPIPSGLRQPIESDLILALRMVVQSLAVGRLIEPTGSMLRSWQSGSSKPSGG